MGNCLRRDSASPWGSDHWASSPVSDHRLFSTNTRNITLHEHDEDKESKSTEDQEGLLSGSKSSKEVKIKISKRHLAELLGKVDMNELSLEQVLAHLINFTDGSPNIHWKPNLQSIPE